MSFEVARNRAGALVIRDRISGEVMHPVGPVVEARTLYVEPSRLSQRLERGPVVLYDVGLGAGSNALAAWARSEDRARGAELHIISFDRTTDALALACTPENATSFGFSEARRRAGERLLETGAARGRLTRWQLVLGDLPGALSRQPLADVVFWDPFSPAANPDLWTVTAFAHLRRRCRDGVTVHTYSASTRVRSALLLAGFAVGSGPATGTKAETTVASTAAEHLARPLTRRFLRRLERSSAPLPADAPAGALDALAAAPQFR